MSLSARQIDALREAAHLGASKAAATLAQLVGDVGVLVDVPLLAQATSTQLAVLLGGRDVPALAARFGIEGPVTGALWWVLKAEDAKRLGTRLLNRPTLSGTFSSNLAGAVREASNIVASACLSAFGTMVHAPLLPSTPDIYDGPLGQIVRQSPLDDGPRTVVLSAFTSTNAPKFAGTLTLVLDERARDDALVRLGV